MDISAAGALPNLRTLEIFGGKISSAELALLFSSTSLEELLLGANAITGLDGIERLAQLKRLNLSRNPVQDILPLTKLPKLEQLSFDVKHGLDLSPLLNCSSLQQLNLTYLTDKAGLFTSWYSKRPGGHIVKALTARGVVVNTRTAS
jgi:Leucine-rich repeat (LRR) protein